MKSLPNFTGKVLTYNPTGVSRVELTDLSNNHSCQTDANSTELEKSGIDHPGCEFEIFIITEYGQQKGIMKKRDPVIDVIPPESSDFTI